MHTAAEIGIDDFQASRSPDKHATARRRCGACSRASKGGFYHDGRFADLEAVVDHYARVLASPASEKNDLVEFLKSL